MAFWEDALARACWISGPDFSYGADDAGYYDADDPALRAQVVSATFEVSEEDAAAGGFELGIAVLGLARVVVNGRALEDIELLGHWTRFDKCVYYDVLDISSYIAAGTNAIEIELGNGFYNPAPLTLFGKYNLRERLAEVGTPQVACAIARKGELMLATDGTWRVGAGGLQFNNIYLGEVVDLALDPVDLGAARVHERPRNLAPSPVPLSRRLGSVDAASITPTEDGVLIDFGEMIAGTIDLSWTARAGQRVEFVYAEIAPNGRIDTDSNVAGLVGMETPRGVCPGGPGAPVPAVQRDIVKCRDGENRYASTFTYHSFRYVLVRGLPAEAIGRVSAHYVHMDLARTGSIDCGNADFARLMDAAVRTKLNNAHDVFEDCSRERFGYGGDMVSLANSSLMLFDEEGLLDKTLADFSRDQTARGGIPETAPFMGIGSNGPAYGEGPLLWQLAYPYLAVQADRYYGRSDLIEREWAGLERFGDYLLAFDPEELSSHCLGDHGSVLTGEEGFKTGTPDKPFLGWCAILWSLDCIVEAATRIGRTAEADRFAEAADNLRTQVVERFGRADGTFGDGTQSACAFAGMLGLGDAEQQAALLVADFQERGDILTTGIFGTMLAFDLLNRTGHNDIVETWLMRRDHPSLLDMLSSGSGALAEQFTPFLSSFDHAMFSSYAQWFFQALGGIRVSDDAVAADTVVVAPYFSPLTDAVQCRYRTKRGYVTVQWRREPNGNIELAVEAPSSITVDVSEIAGFEHVSLKLNVEDGHVDHQ